MLVICVISWLIESPYDRIWLYLVAHRTHCIYASVNMDITGSHNSLSPFRLQAIISTNAGLLLIRPFRINSNEILLKLQYIYGIYVLLQLCDERRPPLNAYIMQNYCPTHYCPVKPYGGWDQGQTERLTRWNQYTPFQLRWGGGYNHKYHMNLQETVDMTTTKQSTPKQSVYFIWHIVRGSTQWTLFNWN